MLVVFLVFFDFKLQVHPPSEPLPSFVYRGNSQVHVSKCLFSFGNVRCKICRFVSQSLCCELFWVLRESKLNKETKEAAKFCFVWHWEALQTIMDSRERGPKARLLLLKIVRQLAGSGVHVRNLDDAPMMIDLFHNLHTNQASALEPLPPKACFWLRLMCKLCLRKFR